MGALPSNEDCIIYNEHGTGTNRKMIKHSLPKVWIQGAKGINQIQAGIESNNTLDLTLTIRDGYKTPQEWSNLTDSEALSGRFYTLRNNDLVIKGNQPNAPATFTTSVEVGKYFGTENAHAITSVNEAKLPGGRTHHFRVLMR